MRNNREMLAYGGLFGRLAGQLANAEAVQRMMEPDEIDAPLTEAEQGFVAFHANNYVHQTRSGAVAELRATNLNRHQARSRRHTFGRRHIAKVVENGVLFVLHATNGWMRQGRVAA